MELLPLPDEFERSKSKLAKIDARRQLGSGWGATTSGQALVRRYHDRLAEAFRVALLDNRGGGRREADLVVLLRGLSPELLALCSIQTILHTIGQREMLLNTLINLGKAISAECWAANLTKNNPRIAARVTKAARTYHSNVSRRITSAQDKVDKLIEKGTLKKTFKARRWGPEALVLAGGWLWNVVSAALPGVFVRNTLAEGPKTTYALTLSDAAWGIVEQALDHAMVSNPVYWPTPTPPKPWTAWDDGGSWDERVSATVLRSYHKDTQATVKDAIKTGQMKPTLDALNALQSVAFKINTQVLEVIEQCDAAGIMVTGLVPKSLQRPTKPNAFAWAGMDETQRGLFHKKAAEVDKTNRGFLGDRILFAEDMKTAFAMLEHPRFYTPMNLDWRGRVYGLSHFNFQREDRVRSLFLFADGLPIGDEGLKWLKIHTANTGDFGKISKRTLKEREQWCDTYRQQITNIASAPLVHTEWMHADKPFLHLAACFELSMAWVQGSSFITRLPLSFDGSCSGLQHLCAMTRADEGSMVNLTSASLPQDVYQAINEDTFTTIAADEENADLAKCCLEYDGDRRKLVKRNVMTYAYSSKKFGMSSQQQVDLMEVLAREVLEGKRKEHPFDGYQHGPYDKHGNQQPSKGARYLAGHVFDAIEARIHKPAEAMKFLQTIAKAMAHEGKPVTWTTPVGIPWINRYHEPEVERVSLFLNDGGLKIRMRLHVTTGSKKPIDKAKAANGVAPNFVHALDAAHLLLVANAATLSGITSIATVHDSFGCLAPQATEFNRIIREQFALMYEKHDVLAEILERASCDLTDANRNKLPPLPTYGSLELKEILNADFAFA